MIYPIYAINDALVGFQSPTLMNNDAFAMRSFSESFADVKSPQDYALFKIGMFDTETGEIIPEVPSVICRATDFVKGENNGERK